MNKEDEATIASTTDGGTNKTNNAGETSETSEARQLTRDEQKEQRRQLIIFKSTELFVKNGYADTKISDIAAAAGMSTGLLFHYFESKEKLFEELVKLGVSYSSQPKQLNIKDPEDYFRLIVEGIFNSAKTNPFVLYMFVLMGQARCSDSIPVHIRELALSVDQIEYSAKVIKAGQQKRVFRKGDPYMLAFTFWCSLQGVLEQIAMNQDFFIGENHIPETEWLLGIIKK